MGLKEAPCQGPEQGTFQVYANWQHHSIEDQAILFMDFYRSLSATERLRKAGMFSSDYWLYSVCH